MSTVKPANGVLTKCSLIDYDRRVTNAAIPMPLYEVLRKSRYVSHDAGACPGPHPAESVAAFSSLASVALGVVTRCLIHHETHVQIRSIDYDLRTGILFDPVWSPVLLKADL